MTRLVLAGLVVLAGNLNADDLPKLKPVEGVAPKGLAKPLTDLLAKTSYSLEEDGQEILHVWIRKEIPTKGEASAFLTCDAIEDGTFVGVYEVKGEAFTDFRGQELKSGVYSMRMSSHPQDGNHMGIATSPQFLVLVPIEEEKSGDAIEREKLMELAKKAAGTGHPAALFTEPFSEKPKELLPRIRENEQKHILLDIGTKALQAGGKRVDLLLAIVFVGQSEGA